MKKANNILLLAGICLYAVNSIIDIWAIIPHSYSDNEGIILYAVINVLFSVIGALLYIALPTVLLCMNLKNKYNKIFAIVVVVLSALAAIYSLIGPYALAIPQYLVLSKIGLLDTYWSYWLFEFLPDSGILSFLSSMLIAIGAILSKSDKNKTEA